jgi:starch synthase (maltosyl-transferring)
MRPPRDGRRRVAIEAVIPQVDAGRFPAKRAAGDLVVVEADVFADGHDQVMASIRHRHERDDEWVDVPMRPLGNDRWTGAFPVSELGTHFFTVAGWVDAFASWHDAFIRKVDAGHDVRVEVKVGARMVARATRQGADQTERLSDILRRMRSWRIDEAVGAATDPGLPALMAAHAARRHVTELDDPLRILVERERARSGAWYELFPRSASPERGGHGTFDDVIALLPDIARQGFDVVYLPPVHPIGRINRKGRNNAPSAEPGDVGSPWAIGADEGGHTAVHPDLGTVDDVERLAERARAEGLELALDLAFQCAPDHPWATEHPEWFERLPDGSIRFAENPPKRYEDIYPLDFSTSAWKELWRALLEVVMFWVDHGIRIFRVDNPHTKPFAFWEWLIGEVRTEHPDVVFLAEAFTRPKVMNRLAKLGFSQSYTYFAWRRSKEELVDYFTELTTRPVSDFFRPNLWPNTPDILTDQLQTGDPHVFAIRFVLAATLAASYGIYGPAFERCEHVPREEGSEEYRDSEKYEIRRWGDPAPSPLRRLIAEVNRIRHEHPALRRDDGLVFHRIDNPELLAFSKRSEDGADVVLTVVNLDPRWQQSGWVDLDLWSMGLDADAMFTVHDLLAERKYEWRGASNYVELRPEDGPAQLFAVEVPVAPGPAEPAAEEEDAPTGHARPAGPPTPEPWREAGS